MRANLIEPNRIELQKGMAQEVYDRVHGRAKSYYIETYGCQMNVRVAGQNRIISKPTAAR